MNATGERRSDRRLDRPLLGSSDAGQSAIYETARSPRSGTAIRTSPRCTNANDGGRSSRFGRRNGRRRRGCRGDARGIRCLRRRRGSPARFPDPHLSERRERSRERGDGKPHLDDRYRLGRGRVQNAAHVREYHRPCARTDRPAGLGHSGPSPAQPRRTRRSRSPPDIIHNGGSANRSVRSKRSRTNSGRRSTPTSSRETRSSTERFWKRSIRTRLSTFERRTAGRASTEKAGRVPRGLTPRVNAVSSIRRVQYVRYTAQLSGSIPHQPFQCSTILPRIHHPRSSFPTKIRVDSTSLWL